jgi:hypothetical protein
MDYTNDYCVANFTPDQKNRMRACFAPGAPLEPFLSSTVGTPPAIGECHTPNSFYATDLKKTSAKLNWPNMVNALSYNIQYRKTTSNTWLTTTSNTNSKQFTGLARSTPYECKVQSVCSGGTSNWSHIFIFSTLSSDPPTSLAKVNLVSPNDGQTGVPANTTITWQTVTGASSYFILYSKTSDFSACYIATTSSTSMTLSRLEVNMQYYWKVRANYAEIFGEWSDYRSFTTCNFEATPPVLRFPINNQMGVSTSPAFYWYTAIGANSYNLQYSTSSTFQTYEQKSNITGTTYIASGLSNRTTYYWRMNSNYNGLPPSDWSTVWKFKTVNSGKYGIPEESGVETTAASLSFAPNPFSDVTHFKLEVFENANVMIEISDALGRKVATLANESYKPGNYEFDFNAMNLLTGVYYCHLISGDEVRTMQMVIMK